MNILVINPNSDPDMTRRIQESARRFAAGEFTVECVGTPGALPFIETCEDQALAAPGMIRLVRENEDGRDAFVVACHCDPNLDMLKEISRKPVVGIGEASMKLATMLGHRFAVISATSRSIPNKEALIRKYHLEALLASIRSPKTEPAAVSDFEGYLEAARRALEEDGAEVIVLGCAGMSGLEKQLQHELQVPVLEGVACALMVAAGFVRAGLSTSKRRRYRAGRD